MSKRDHSIPAEAVAIGMAIAIVAFIVVGMSAQAAASPLEDLSTSRQFREFDYSRLSEPEIERLHERAEERLIERVSAKYEEGYIQAVEDINENYWCHGDDALTELQINLVLIKSRNRHSERLDARQRLDNLLSEVLAARPAMPEAGRLLHREEDVGPLLDRMVEIDQFYANLVIREFENILQSLQQDSHEIRAFQHLLYPHTCRAYEALGRIANDILDRYGWPGPEAGANASHNMWLIYQHQDANIDWQKRALRHMEVRLDSGEVSRSDYAYLFDRVAVNEGRLQRYGTQLDGCGIKPVEDEPRLDQRRTAMGLPPIDEYLQSTINCKSAEEYEDFE